MKGAFPDRQKAQNFSLTFHVDLDASPQDGVPVVGCLAGQLGLDVPSRQRRQGQVGVGLFLGGFQID